MRDKTIVKCSERTEWRNDIQESIGGYFSIKIGFSQAVQALLAIMDTALSRKMEETENNENELILKFYLGQGDFLVTLEDLYRFAEEVENIVYPVMEEDNVTDFELTLYVSTTI